MKPCFDKERRDSDREKLKNKQNKIDSNTLDIIVAELSKELSYESDYHFIEGYNDALNDFRNELLSRLK